MITSLRRSNAALDDRRRGGADTRVSSFGQATVSSIRTATTTLAGTTLETRSANARPSSSPRRSIHGFHPPLDIVDGTARIVDPLLDGINTGNHVWGLFLKDHRSAPW